MHHDRSKKAILITVIGIHLTLILWMCLSFSPFKISNKKHLVVKTHAPSLNARPLATAPPMDIPPPKKPTPPTPLAPESPPPIEEPPPLAPPEPGPPPPIEKKPLPPKKKAPAVTKAKAPLVRREEGPKKSAKVKKSPPSHEPIPQSLLKELEESIAKIEGKRDNLYRKEKVSAPPPLQIDNLKNRESSVREEGEAEYQLTLVQCLHHSLNLPEFGEVKIQLTLKQDGTVEGVVVMKAESEKNRQYLQKNLPLLKFPQLSGPFSNKKQHTFILTFCNELS